LRPERKNPELPLMLYYQAAWVDHFPIFVIQVSGFKFPVSDFKFPVSSFRVQILL